MTIIQMPTDLVVGSFAWGQMRYDSEDASDLTGDSFTLVYGPPRWRIAMGSAGGMSLDQGAKWETLLLQLRGRINVLAAFDPVRIAPQGTMRGAPFVESFTAAGATSLVLANATGTLAEGDLLQLGNGLGTSQLVKLVAAATGSLTSVGTPGWINNSSQVVAWANPGAQVVAWANGGRMTINFEAPLRRAIAAGTAVTWDRPRAYFRATSPTANWSYRPGSVAAVEAHAVDLLETFA